MSYDVPDYTVETLADGMISLLRKNLVSYSPLIRDAHAGDMVIYVNDTLRFYKFQGIVVMDDNSKMDPNTFAFTGVDFETVWDDITDVNTIVLNEPLTQDFLVANHGRIQKALKGTI